MSAERSNVIALFPQRTDLSAPDMRDAQLRDAVLATVEAIERERRERRRHTLGVLALLAFMFACSAAGLWLVRGGS
jgi:hypothetical protein